MMIPQGCFAFNVHQDDVRADLLDVAPRDDVFAAVTEETEEFSRTGNDYFLDTTGTDVKFHIAYKPQTGAIPTVDDFLLTQIAQTHGKSSYGT